MEEHYCEALLLPTSFLAHSPWLQLLRVKSDMLGPSLAAINQPMGTGTLKRDGLLGQQELDGQEVQEESHWLDFYHRQPSKAFLPSLPAQPTASWRGN